MQKLCLGCSFGFGLTAVVLVIIALSTDFWYFRSSSAVVNLNFYNTAVAYGLIDYCYYASTSKSWTINTDDDNWSCAKWDDANTSGNSAADDCKKACTNGLAWDIMGLLATAPAAVICIVTCFCAETCMSGFCGKCMSFLAIGALVFATVAFVIAPAVLSGECEDLNKNPFTQLSYGTWGQEGKMGMSFSFICQLVAIFFTLISLICYLVFFFLKPKGDGDGLDAHGDPYDKPIQYPIAGQSTQA
jgi:hypothetical protein